MLTVVAIGGILWRNAPAGIILFDCYAQALLATLIARVAYRVFIAAWAAGAVGFVIVVAKRGAASFTPAGAERGAWRTNIVIGVAVPVYARIILGAFSVVTRSKANAVNTLKAFWAGAIIAGQDVGAAATSSTGVANSTIPISGTRKQATLVLTGIARLAVAGFLAICRIRPTYSAHAGITVWTRAFLAASY